MITAFWKLTRREYQDIVNRLERPTVGIRSGDTLATWDVDFEDGHFAHLAVVSCGDEETPYLDVSLFDSAGCEVASEVTLDVSALPRTRHSGQEYQIQVKVV